MNMLDEKTGARKGALRSFRRDAARLDRIGALLSFRLPLR
jgi:hypothetical protein